MPGPWNPARNEYNLKQANLAHQALTRTKTKRGSTVFNLQGNAARFAQNMKPEEIYKWIHETAKQLKENK